jgi:hypothetical protein
MTMFTGAATDDVGALAGAITADAVLVAVPEPPAFDAVTTTRNVLPTSVDVKANEDPVAPAISRHEPPPESQRRHWYAYDVGLFDHEPVDADSVWPSCGVPLMVGRDVFAGGAVTDAGAAATTADAALVADPEPPAFDAVTTTRSVLPTSADVNANEAVVAPAIEAHELPLVSQRLHWYAYDVGLFDHEPFDADSVWPCCAVPLIVGRDVFTGAAMVGVEPETTADAALVAVLDPPALVAVTTVRSVLPTSADVSANEPVVAPAIGVQALPLLSQRCHWCAYEVGAFVQMPGEVESVWPSFAVPEISGGVRLAGGGGTTTLVAALVTELLPALFDAVTLTRIVFPTSVAASRYCDPVAPVIAAHAPPAVSQRFH